MLRALCLLNLAIFKKKKFETKSPFPRAKISGKEFAMKTGTTLAIVIVLAIFSFGGEAWAIESPAFAFRADVDNYGLTLWGFVEQPLTERFSLIGDLIYFEDPGVVQVEGGLAIALTKEFRLLPMISVDCSWDEDGLHVDHFVPEFYALLYGDRFFGEAWFFWYLPVREQKNPDGDPIDEWVYLRAWLGLQIGKIWEFDIGVAPQVEYTWFPDLPEADSLAVGGRVSIFWAKEDQEVPHELAIWLAHDLKQEEVQGRITLRLFF